MTFVTDSTVLSMPANKAIEVWINYIFNIRNKPSSELSFIDLKWSEIRLSLIRSDLKEMKKLKSNEENI